MTLRICRTTVIALTISIALPAWGQQYLLYSPQPVTSAQKSASQDGILVQELEIQKGDTLYDISRKFSGRGMYYPQILLFNSIKNPNLIYTGSTLRIPVSHDGVNNSEQMDAKPPASSKKIKKSHDKKNAHKVEVQPSAQDSVVFAPSTELSVSDLKATEKVKSSAKQKKSKSAFISKKEIAHKTSITATDSSQLPATLNRTTTEQPTGDASSGQKLFEAAVKAYRLDDCRTALGLLDRYLADNSGSPLAADANLYKAECYLKMSAQ